MLRDPATKEELFPAEYLARFGSFPVDRHFKDWGGKHFLQKSLAKDGYTLLFATITGSHMYGMERPTSDYDLSVIYQASTRRILRGEPVSPTMDDFIHHYGPYGRECDEQYRELGHLVQQLVEGNVNAIWQVCSPAVAIHHPLLTELRAITMDNLSRSTYKSIKGMAVSQFKDETKRAGRIPKGKGYWSCIRTCNFGIQMLRDHVVRFTPVDLSRPFTERDAEVWLYALDSAYEESTLPDIPKEEPLRDFLESARMSTMAPYIARGQRK